MIIKGASRAGPKQLANHLLRTDTNERVQVLELHSPIGELHEAFRDWQTLASATRGSKGLYHANIDPAKGYDMTREQWLRAVEVLEKELGLDGQPRAVVLHEKNGREHVHVVWQRTDPDSMTLVSDGWNYKAHERASLALELEFGHEHVPGKHEKRDRDHQPEPPKADISHAEWQQKDRTGIDPRDRKDQITGLYEQSDNAQAFRAALAEEGYLLAKGDRRDYVLVDEFGEIHSLTRQIRNERAADIRAFLAPLPRDTIPDIAEARRLQADRPPPEPEPPGDQKPPTPEPPQETEAERAFRAALDAREAKDFQTLYDNHDIQARNLSAALDRDLKAKMDAFDAMQKADRERFYEEHKLKGLDGYLDAVDRRLRPKVAAEREADRRKEWEDFHERQRIERRDHLTLLRQDRNEEIDVLLEKQAKEAAEMRHQHALDRERYREERAEAERRAREIEEQRQLDQEKKRSRDGPDTGPTR